MKKWLIIGMLLLLAAGEVTAQQRVAKRPRGARRSGWAIMGSDSTLQVDILPVYVFNRPADLRKYRRLVDAVKKVYPLAQIAKGKLYEMEQQLLTIRGKKRQRAYIKHCYNQILEEYTPVAKRMTRTQGRVLVKLIDRETEYTAYEVIREFRGGFVASFWQGVGKLFGHDLKSQYNKEDEDRVLEQIVLYYEAGLL